MKRLAILLLVLAIGFLGYGITLTAGASAEVKVHKSYVCKYVNTPGEGEVLQTGNNPIWVDNNSLLGEDGETFVGQEFTDAQGRSVVIVANTAKLDPEPTVEDCPPPNNPPTAVQFSGFPTPTPPTCLAPGDLVLPDILGLDWTIEPAFTGPGTYTVTATLEDPENTTFPDGTTAPKTTTITVEGQLTGEECEPSEAPPGTNPPGSTPPVAFPPDNPGNPGNPDNPDNPGNPGNPDNPGNPGNPGAVVPTEVDAGLPGIGATSNLGWGLVGLGALLLGTAVLL
ncbi:MAG: hypothetical protein ACRDOX_06475, partial [Nocardioides sp.]